MDTHDQAIRDLEKCKEHTARLEEALREIRLRANHPEDVSIAHTALESESRV